MAIDIEKPKYSIDDRVLARGWTRSDTGTIVDVKKIFHLRLGEHTWGYMIDYDNKKPVLALTYVPEGYLSKLEIKNDSVDCN